LGRFFLFICSMYVLIADSGSTKTDWVLLHQSKILKRLKTIGFSPYFQTKEQIIQEIRVNLIPHISDALNKISTIHYYGTGCSNAENCLFMQDCLSQTLHAKQINVSHDLLAAARALCKNEWGLACILGTGSNSCLYNGIDILENVPSVGYLWGDHGSGAQIGKNFIKEYFEETLPTDLKKQFEDAGYNREIILNHVYKQSMPSRYLASVSMFVSQHLQNPFVVNMLSQCFDSFFVQQINKYTHSKKYKVHTVGSIGYHYKNLIVEAAKRHDYEMGMVLQSPMDGLIDYHLQNG
jgi:glucosamine kinase